MEIEVVPAVLEESVEEVEKKLERVRGLVERVGVDIIDGVFADNLTIGVEDLVAVDLSGWQVEVQLMTEYPIDHLDACKEVGVARVFGQVERMGSQKKFVERCCELGLGAGLALDLYTPVSAVEKERWEEVSGVLLMSVKAGFSGQEFDERVLEKIRQVRQRGFEGDVQVDGGMNPKTVRRCAEAGANQFCVTSWLWGREDVKEALAELRGQ